MKPIKSTVYLPVENDREFYLSDSSTTGVVKKEGYFFTPEQLNEYTAKVGKTFLETAAEKASVITCDVDGSDTCDIDKQSITNTFEETFNKFKV